MNQRAQELQLGRPGPKGHCRTLAQARYRQTPRGRCCGDGRGRRSTSNGWSRSSWPREVRPSRPGAEPPIARAARGQSL
jgi:hypothetical protein